MPTFIAPEYPHSDSVKVDVFTLGRTISLLTNKTTDYSLLEMIEKV